jgi:hypothetical protein
MKRELWITVIVALAALLLTLLVLIYVERNPWMLMGLAAILWAIAAIVRAIRGTPPPEDEAPGLAESGGSPTEDIAGPETSTAEPAGAPESVAGLAEAQEGSPRAGQNGSTNPRRTTRRRPRRTKQGSRTRRQ